MIYIVKHKKCETPKLDGFKDLEVGELYKGYCSMNRYNPYLNETTAMFDIVASGDDIIGLVHYRRLFKDLTYDKAVELLQTYEVITAPCHEPESPYKHLTDNIGKGLVDKYLKQLPYDVQNWFYGHNSFNICNMFVSKREFLVGYLEFIYPVFAMADQFIEEDKTSNVRRNRTLGYICECLFGYYCKDKNRYLNPIQDI